MKLSAITPENHPQSASLLFPFKGADQAIQPKAWDLKVKFKDVGRNPHSIPDDVLERLAHDVQEFAIHYFRPTSARTREELKENKGKQLELTAFERTRAINTTKAAFDQHRIAPYPGDPAQTALLAVEQMMVKSLSSDFGPTAVKSLHPIVSFTKG